MCVIVHTKGQIKYLVSCHGILDRTMDSRSKGLGVHSHFWGLQCVKVSGKLLIQCCLCVPTIMGRIPHSTKKPVTTMLTYPWKCTVLHCNHLGNTWKPLVLMTRHFDYCPSASEGDNQSVRSSAPVVSRCFPGGYNVKLYISRGRLAWWLLAFLHGACWANIVSEWLKLHVYFVWRVRCIVPGNMRLFMM